MFFFFLKIYLEFHNKTFISKFHMKTVEKFQPYGIKPIHFMVSALKKFCFPTICHALLKSCFYCHTKFVENLLKLYYPFRVKLTKKYLKLKKL